MLRDDTIAAISTPPGRGGIGVVRLSGPASLEILSSFFKPSAAAPIGQSNRAQFGHVLDPATGEPIDEAVLTFFKAPRSYTGQDVAELSCHGSPVVLRRVLEIVVEAGARIAEPGEFTMRAFFNRRIDLAQAQAVRDVINAQTDYQARLATRQLEGALSRRLGPPRESLVEVIVQLESALEFVEEDISPETAPALLVKLGRVADSLGAIAGGFALGRYVKEGFDLAIVGRPNVGKSSVFNRLVGVERAIVTALPGTTRDALYEATSIAGVPVRLIDTAGIRETADQVESLGIERSRSAIADADISLLVLDASEPIAEDDLRLLGQVPAGRRIVALNKADLPPAIGPGDIDGAQAEEVITISAATGGGFDELTRRILGRLAGDEMVERDDVMITDARQHAAIRRAISELGQARDLMMGGEPEEVILIKLHGALFALGEITGETLTDDILGQIFSTFCVGK